MQNENIHFRAHFWPFFVNNSKLPLLGRRPLIDWSIAVFALVDMVQVLLAPQQNWTYCLRTTPPPRIFLISLETRIFRNNLMILDTARSSRLFVIYILLQFLCFVKFLSEKNSVWKETTTYPSVGNFGAMINGIRTIWSSYNMIAYIIIFVHNDRLRTVHDDIQTVKIDIQ